MPRFEIDQNGNVRSSIALNVGIDISHPGSEQRNIVMDGSAELKAKAKIEKIDGELTFKFKELELGQLKIVNWDGEQ